MFLTPQLVDPPLCQLPCFVGISACLRLSHASDTARTFGCLAVASLLLAGLTASACCLPAQMYLLLAS